MSADIGPVMVEMLEDYGGFRKGAKVPIGPGIAPDWIKVGRCKPVGPDLPNVQDRRGDVPTTRLNKPAD